MKGGICTLLVLLLACSQPTSSRACFKYVPHEPPAKRYKVVKILKAQISRYIKPERKYYSSDAAYRKAIKLNGKGKETYFKTTPQENFTIAANVNPSENGFKKGTIIKINGHGINLIGEVEDRCVAAEKLWKRKRIIQFDIFSKMSQKQADDWGKREMTVEILQPI